MTTILDGYEVNLKIRDTTDGKVAVTFAPSVTRVFGAPLVIGPSERVWNQIYAFIKQLEKAHGHVHVEEVKA